jgi:hypothetical protein
MYVQATLGKALARALADAEMRGAELGGGEEGGPSSDDASEEEGEDPVGSKVEEVRFLDTLRHFSLCCFVLSGGFLGKCLSGCLRHICTCTKFHITEDVCWCMGPYLCACPRLLGSSNPPPPPSNVDSCRHILPATVMLSICPKCRSST